MVDQATCFPVSMARGATWDADLEERIGEAIGRELRAVGADLYGGVCVNVLRHPAWGRAQETYGEDPHHVGEMGAALTRGVQRHAMACVKHFACNSMENARFTVDVTVDEVGAPRGLPPPLQAHRGRGRGRGDERLQQRQRRVVRGEPSHSLTEILRDEWGFEGFVISDWILGTPRRRGVRSQAGLDVEMPYRMIRAGHLGRGPRAWRGDLDRGRPGRRADRGHPAAVRRRARCAGPGPGASWPAGPPGPGPGGCGQVGGAPAQRAGGRARRSSPSSWPPARSWPCSGGWPPPSTSATADRVTCGRPRW